MKSPHAAVQCSLHVGFLIHCVDFLVLAGVYGFYDDEDGDQDNSQKIVSFLNTGSIREGE